MSLSEVVLQKHVRGCTCVSLVKVIELIQVYFGNISPFEETDEQYYGLVREMVLKRASLSPWESEFLSSMTYAMASKRAISLKQKAVVLRMATRYLMSMGKERARELAGADEEICRAMVLE